jgi:hypothetical protein
MAKSNKVGRRPALILVPTGKFTMQDWLDFNLDNKNEITMLTLRKRQKQFVVRLASESEAPDNKNGLGRKKFVFRAKAGVVTGKSVAKAAPVAEVAAVKPHKSRKSVTQTADALDAKKKELGIDVPASIPDPEPVTVPLDAVPSPAEAPVAEAPVATTAAEPVAA